MTTVSQLSQLSSITAADQIIVYSPNQGALGRASISELQELLVPPQSIQDISSYFFMREMTGGVIAVGTSFQNLVNWDSSGVLPTGRDALAASTTLGEFVATRDILGINCYASLVGTWPTNRDLTLQILIGSDASPYETALMSVEAGRGANVVTMPISGPTINFNDPQFLIRAGQKVRLAVKFNVADNLTLIRAAFAVQTLDGI